MVERYFWWDSGDFWCCENGWKHWFLGILSNSVSNSKWGLRRGNIRYSLSGNRTFVLKCKLSPLPGVKTYYNSTVLWYVLWCQVKMLYTFFRPDVWSVKWKYLTCFRVYFDVRILLSTVMHCLFVYNLFIFYLQFIHKLFIHHSYIFNQFVHSLFIIYLQTVHILFIIRS